jgi:hypothetical protein
MSQRPEPPAQPPYPQWDPPQPVRKGKKPSPIPQWDPPQPVRKAKQPPPIPQWDPPVQVIRPPKQERSGPSALAISASAALLLCAFGIGFGPDLAGEDSTGTPAPAPTVTVTATADAPVQSRVAPSTPEKTTNQRPDPRKAAFDPKPKDFKISIAILEKQCPGSAGCTISYRITLFYVGSQKLPAKGVTKVTYLVSGGVSPITNTLALTKDFTVPSYGDLIDTPSSSAELTATVTKVMYDQFG